MTLQEKLAQSRIGKYRLTPSEVVAAMRIGQIENFSIEENDNASFTLDAFIQHLQPNEGFDMKSEDGFLVCTLTVEEEDTYELAGVNT